MSKLVVTTRLAGAILATCTVSHPARAQDAPKVSRPGQYSGYSAERFDSFVRVSRYVQARDGTRLSITFYRPARGGVASDERFPVVFSFTPYLARRNDGPSSVESGRAGGRPFVDLVKHGYVVAIADVRGRGSSFGVRRAYNDRVEGQDGYDLVEWLGTQSWSSGKVGMFGCSYVGGTQWATARNAPPHLKAIFPESGLFDSYRHVLYGGISSRTYTRLQDVSEDLPSAPVDADKDGTLRTAAIKQHEQDGAMMDLVTATPFRDDRTSEDIDYWGLSSPYPVLDKIKAAGIAVYNAGNWKDEISDQPMLAFENLRSSGNLDKLLLGPAFHCQPDTLNVFNEHLRFYDHVLKGIDNGIDREPPIVFKTTGLDEAEAWRFADHLPLTTGDRRRFYLAEGGSLAHRAGRRAIDSYQVTYKVGCPPLTKSGFATPEPPNRIGDYTLPVAGEWACVNPAIAKTYTMAPLREDMWLTGWPILKLTMATDTPDTFIFAYLEDVAPDGTAAVVMQGRLLASHRKLGKAPYRNFGLPWTTHLRADARPMTPGKPEELVLAMTPTSRIVQAGHRLRLSLTGLDQRQKRVANILPNPLPRWTISLGGASASYVDMNLLPKAQLLSSTRSIGSGASR